MTRTRADSVPKEVAETLYRLRQAQGFMSAKGA